MRNIPFLTLLFLSLILKAQSKFEPLRKQLIESKKYEYVYAFENNYAGFRTFNDKMGLIDSVGNVVIKPNYVYIRNQKDLKNLFEAGIIVNKKYKRGFIDLQSNIKIPFEYDEIFYLGNNLIRVAKNNKTGVINTENKIILPLQYDFIMEQNGILFVQTGDFVTIFDSNGKPLTNFKAKDIEYFTDGKSIATLQNDSTLIIDTTGQIVLNSIKDHKFEKVIKSDRYLILNTITKKKGIVNSSGEFEVKCKYNDIFPSKSIYIANYNGKSGLITQTDSILKPFIYDFIYAANCKEDENPFENLYIIEKDGLSGIVKPFLEKEVIPIAFKNIGVYYNNFAATNSENKNTLYSAKGETIIPAEYEFYTGFQNKIFASKNNKNYLLTFDNKSYTTEEILIEKLIKENYFTNSISKSKYQVAKDKNKFGVLSYENKIVIPFDFDSIDQIYATGDFVVKKNKKCGIINAKNEVVIELKYDFSQIVKEFVKFRNKDGKNPTAYEVNFENDVR